MIIRSSDKDRLVNFTDIRVLKCPERLSDETFKERARKIFSNYYVRYGLKYVGEFYEDDDHVTCLAVASYFERKNKKIKLAAWDKMYEIIEQLIENERVCF